MELVLIEKDQNKYIEEIIELEKDVFGENGAVDYWNLKPLIKYGRVYALLNMGQIVACTELTKDWGGKKVYIYGFAVKKNEYNKGYGSILLEKVLQVLKEEGIDEVELTVDEKNIAAVKLYKKYGFIETEKLKNEYGKGIDRILLKKNKIKS